MNVHSSPPTDPDAFLRWNEGREGKRELVRGRVVEMMTGATYGHARKIRQLSRLLEDRLDSRAFEVVTSDVGVKTGTGVRYPDIVVDVAGSDPESLIAQAPVLIVEVLSPSSVVIDTVQKAAEYKELASLQAYIVMAQHDPDLWIWQRHSEGWHEAKIEGPDGVVEIPSMNLLIPFRELYPDFRFD